MFDRFTESASRVVFWARGEASRRGNGAIAPEHLLLGILREDPLALKRFGLSAATIASLREKIHNLLPECAIPTSVDMPLTASARSVLLGVVSAGPGSAAIHPFDMLIGDRQTGRHARCGPFARSSQGSR